MKKAVRMHLVGTVQPLFFRPFIKERADAQGVRGFVRKLDDGKIEIFMEGDRENVDAMINFCKEGPRHTNIRGYEVKEEKLQDFREFKVLSF